MSMKKKKIRYFWEKPFEKVRKSFDEPFEFRFTIPRIAFPQIRYERTIPITMGETDKEIVIKAELPGFKKNEINLNVTENFIEISAAKKEERIEKTERMYRHERMAGAVKRAFSLPENVDVEKVEAKLDDGLLTVVLPKLYPEVKKKKKIEIK